LHPVSLASGWVQGGRNIDPPRAVVKCLGQVILSFASSPRLRLSYALSGGYSEKDTCASVKYPFHFACRPMSSRMSATRQLRPAAQSGSARLGERVRQLRVAAGLTQTDLAGNTSVASASYAVTIDTTAAAPVITGFTTDSGTVGDHGTAIMIARGEFELAAEVESDTRSLWPAVDALLGAAGPGLRCVRDATRGGVASVLNELARASGVAMLVREAAVPVDPARYGLRRPKRAGCASSWQRTICCCARVWPVCWNVLASTWSGRPATAHNSLPSCVK